MTINANVGYAPWDILSQGLNNTLGITMGQANIYAGFVIIIIDTLLGQAVGWGTIANMFIIGRFMDILMLNNLIPSFAGFVPSVMMLLLGVLVSGYASWIYISVGLGAGPRDGLMVALTRKTGKSVRVVKSLTEILVVGVGYLLGGKFGIGTIILALFGGPIYQFSYKTVNFDVKSVKHRFIQDDIKYLKEKIKESSNTEES